MGTASLSEKQRIFTKDWSLLAIYNHTLCLNLQEGWSSFHKEVTPFSKSRLIQETKPKVRWIPSYDIQYFSCDSSTLVQMEKGYKTFLHPLSSQERFSLRKSLSWPWGEPYLVTNENETFVLEGTSQAHSRACCEAHSKDCSTFDRLAGGGVSANFSP